MSSAKNGTDQALQSYGNQSQVPVEIGTYITCLVIAYTGVALRFVSRRLKRTQLKTDDWLIVVSLVRYKAIGDS